MRSLITIALALIMLAIPGSGTAADKTTQRAKPTKTELAEKQARGIARGLDLDSELADRFVATYVKCQKEIWALRPARAKNKKQKASLTDQQVDSILLARFDHSQKMLDIRRKYHSEYRKFLSARQVERAYDLERDMMKHLDERRAAATKGHQKAPEKAKKDKNSSH